MATAWGEPFYEEDVDPEFSRSADPSAAPTPMADLLSAVVPQGARGTLGAAWQAQQAWREANGDRERAHTCGVFLAPARVRGAAPRLVVYLDSNVLLTDFRTNAELYLGRLAAWGLQVSGIDFRLSRDAGKRRRPTDEKDLKPPAPPLPPLDERDGKEIDEMVAGLPEGLREKARDAARLSYRRNAAQ